MLNETVSTNTQIDNPKNTTEEETKEKILVNKDDIALLAGIYLSLYSQFLDVEPIIRKNTELVNFANLFVGCTDSLLLRTSNMLGVDPV